VYVQVVFGFLHKYVFVHLYFLTGNITVPSFTAVVCLEFLAKAFKAITELGIYYLISGVLSLCPGANGMTVQVKRDYVNRKI